VHRAVELTTDKCSSSSSTISIRCGFVIRQAAQQIYSKSATNRNSGICA